MSSIRRHILALVLLLLLFLGALSPFAASAQSFAPRVAVKLGLTQEFAYYSEVEVTRRLLTVDEQQVAVDGSVYVAHWNERFGIAECNLTGTVCERSWQAAVRTGIALTKAPIGVFGGLSYSVVDREGVVPRSGRPIDERSGYMGAEAGLRSDIALVGRLRLVIQAQVHVSLSERRPPGLASYSMGLSYSL